jgi:hypothetical protein
MIGFLLSLFAKKLDRFGLKDEQSEKKEEKSSSNSVYPEGVIL